MNIDDQKEKILDHAIRSRKSNRILELGTFLGYSSLRMVSQVPNDTFIISIGRNPDSARIAHEIHTHAGVGDRIKIIVDSTINAILRLSQIYYIHAFDLIFIDHYGSAYLHDFKLLEQYGLIQSGTMIIANTIIYPDASDYLYYIRNNPNYTTKTYE